MFRKIAISLVAAMTLGAASIATPASAAHGGFNGGGGRGAFRGGGFAGRGFGGFERRGFGDFGRGFGYFGGYPYGYPYYPYAPYYPYYYSPYGGSMSSSRRFLMLELRNCACPWAELAG